MNNTIKWTEETIREALEKMISETGITHFPTHKELNDFYGNHALSVVLSRRGGTRRWCKILNLSPRACSNTCFGNKYERKAIEDIEKETGIKSELTKERYPYDVYTDNGTKIDIKASMPMRGRNFECWSFSLEKRVPTCDIYIFYCIGWDDEVKKRVIIPSCAIAGIKQMSIGGLCRYDNYIERWDLIKEYDVFMNDMKNKIDILPKRRTMYP